MTNQDITLRGVRFADGRPIPQGSEINLHNNGDGTLAIELALPDSQTEHFRLAPTADGWLEIPVEIGGSY